MNALDIRLFHLINNWASRFNLLDQIGIFFAETTPYVLAAFLTFRWFWNQNFPEKRKALIIAGLTFGLSEAAAKLLGRWYYHVQPFVTLEANQLIAKEVNNSFPSDHTILVFSFLFVLFLSSQSISRWLYLGWAILASTARIFVGVHYPSDVLAAALLANIIGSIFYYFLRRANWLKVFVHWISSMEKRLLHKRA